MGTNYYHRHDPCPHCGHSDEETHIGKSSFGWTFSFHGTDEIQSWAQWRKKLESGGAIYDEYGDLMPVCEFVALVESKRIELLNHTIYCRVNHPEHAANDCWLDDEGNSFSSGEFS